MSSSLDVGGQPSSPGRIAARLWQHLLDLVFPPCCAGCGRVDHILCPTCRQSISWVEPPFCPRCARPVATSQKACAFERASACVSCSDEPLRLDGVGAAVEFSGVIRSAVHAFKYRGRRELAAPLAGLMVTAWGEGMFPADCVVPVPLHPRRLRERGYNQAALLAKYLAQGIDLPRLRDALVRSLETESQTLLSAADRRSNVVGAFAADREQVVGRSVLLVDDVCTTCSTLQACADSLRAAGAARVYAVALARAGWNPTTGVMDDTDHWRGRAVF